MVRTRKYFLNSNNKYPCPHCVQEFPQTAGLIRHVKRQHPSQTPTITIETTPLRRVVSSSADLLIEMESFINSPQPKHIKSIKAEITFMDCTTHTIEFVDCTTHAIVYVDDGYVPSIVEHDEGCFAGEAETELEVVAERCEPEVVAERCEPTPKKTSKKPTIQDKYTKTETELYNHPYAYAYQRELVFRCLAGEFTTADKLIKAYPMYCDKVRSGTLWAMHVINGVMTEEEVQEERKKKIQEINKDATNFMKFREATERYTKAKKAYNAKLKRDAKKQPQTEEPRNATQPEPSSDTSSEVGTDESCDDTDGEADEDDDEEDEEEEAYLNAIDVLVAKLTNVNNIHKQVYRWITLTLKRQYITEEDFMNGVYHIYEINKQHNLKGSIPTDLYKGYENYMITGCI